MSDSLKNIRTERLSEANMPHLRFLYNTIFGKKESLNYLKSKYTTPASESRYLSFLAYAEEKPVAFYGAIPQRFRRGEEISWGAHTCDSLTLPEWQGQGLHALLAKESYALMQEQGFRFVYAYHSENTFHSCKKLGWQVARNLLGCEISISKLPVSGLRHQLGFSRQNLNKAGVLKNDKSFIENPWSQVGRFWQVDYDLEWFKYKRFSPNGVVQAGPLKAWIRLKTDLWVGAMEAGTPPQIKTALRALIELGRQVGATKILFQMESDSPVLPFLEENNIVFECFRLGYFSWEPDFEIGNYRFNLSDLDTF